MATPDASDGFGRGPSVRPGPNTWLVPAVIATLCCFAPTGVIAVFFAARVGVLWDRGEFAAARDTARVARLWVVVSIVLWAVALVILVASGRAGRLLESGLL